MYIVINKHVVISENIVHSDKFVCWMPAVLQNWLISVATLSMISLFMLANFFSSSMRWAEVAALTISSTSSLLYNFSVSLVLLELSGPTYMADLDRSVDLICFLDVLPNP